MKTKAYWIPLVDRRWKVHKILAFMMKCVTNELSYIKMEGVAMFFPRIRGTEIKRPCGEVNLLVGI